MSWCAKMIFIGILSMSNHSSSLKIRQLMSILSLNIGIWSRRPYYYTNKNHEIPVSWTRNYGHNTIRHQLPELMPDSPRTRFFFAWLYQIRHRTQNMNSSWLTILEHIHVLSSRSSIPVLTSWVSWVHIIFPRWFCSIHLYTQTVKVPTTYLYYSGTFLHFFSNIFFLTFFSPFPGHFLLPFPREKALSFRFCKIILN